MTKFVVDANVALKWVLPEIHAEAALRLQNSNYALLVPDFFFPEIGNVLWKRVQRSETSLDVAQNDLLALMGLPLQICQSFPLMPQALEIAVRVRHYKSVNHFPLCLKPWKLPSEFVKRFMTVYIWLWQLLISVRW